MIVAKQVKTEHADVIHDVSFDHRGKRMATCSSDQTVKIWDEDKEGKWICSSSWRAHFGSVWRVTWAHPEYGQILATCSFDCTVAVWEETKTVTARAGTNITNWPHKASLVDSRKSVTDVRFGPKHMGLLLAACSVDGIVRIYEAVDVMEISNWPLQQTIAVTVNNTNVSLSCLSWSSSRLHPATIAVGSDDNNFPTDPKVFIYRYNDGSRKWDLVETLADITDPVQDVRFAPHLGRSFHLLAVASHYLNIFKLTDAGEEHDNSQKHHTGFEVQQVGNFDDHKSLVWRLSWSVFGNKLASTGNDGSVLLWKANHLGQWQCQPPLRGMNMAEMERVSIAAASISSTPTSSLIRMTPPSTPGRLNIKRTSGWPNMDIDVDQGKMYY